MDLLCFSAQWGPTYVYWCVWIEGKKNPSKEHPDGEPGTGDDGDALRHKTVRSAERKEKNVEGKALANGGGFAVQAVDRDTFDLEFFNVDKIDAGSTNGKVQLTALTEGPKNGERPGGGCKRPPTVTPPPSTPIDPAAHRKLREKRVAWESKLSPFHPPDPMPPVGGDPLDRTQTGSRRGGATANGHAKPLVGVGALLVGYNAPGDFQGGGGTRVLQSIPFLYKSESPREQVEEWAARLDAAGIDVEEHDGLVVAVRFRKTGRPVRHFGLATGMDALGLMPAFPWIFEVYSALPTTHHSRSIDPIGNLANSGHVAAAGQAQARAETDAGPAPRHGGLQSGPDSVATHSGVRFRHSVNGE